ncbi:hypothetical protein ACKKBG_A13400 [Auxenochlorella protothecoides x Auxenochlorella symbiontica]
MSDPPAADAGEVVVTHSALDTVAAWLGISDAAALLAKSGDDALESGQRQGLGLGATFVPHYKAAMLSKADASLAKSLKRSGVFPAHPPQHGRFGSQFGSPAASMGQRNASAMDQAGLDDDEEEEGRGCRALGTSTRPALASKSQLLTSAKALKRKGQKAKKENPG